MSQFRIVCPGCGNSNTLRMVIRSEKTYPILAHPSKPVYGLGPAMDFLTSKHRTIECVEDNCGWSTVNQITNKDIVRPVEEEAPA